MQCAKIYQVRASGAATRGGPQETWENLAKKSTRNAALEGIQGEAVASASVSWGMQDEGSRGHLLEDTAAMYVS